MNFRRALVDYIREQAKPVDKFSHQKRLYGLTREIAVGQRYDDDVVLGQQLKPPAARGLAEPRLGALRSFLAAARAEGCGGNA